MDVKAFSGDAWELETSGAVALVFSELAPRSVYELAVDGKAERRAATGRRIAVDVPAGTHGVTLKRLGD